MLEVGQIGIMSFGESTKVVSSFDEPFNDSIGARLFSQFTFAQKKTRINELLDRAQEMMQQAKNSQTAKQMSQLLMIISDGRGLFNEGEQALRLRIKQLYDQGLFVVFLILDNPDHKDSIMDIMIPEFDAQGKVSLSTYMEKFPFPFYILLRNIAQMPLVLGEALRQWFELVTVNDN
jgi:midasin